MRSRYIEPRTARVVTLVSWEAWQCDQVTDELFAEVSLTPRALAIRMVAEDFARRDLIAMMGADRLVVEHVWGDEVVEGVGRLVSVGRTPGLHVVEEAR